MLDEIFKVILDNVKLIYIVYFIVISIIIVSVWYIITNFKYFIYEHRWKTSYQSKKYTILLKELDKDIFTKEELEQRYIDTVHLYQSFLNRKYILKPSIKNILRFLKHSIITIMILGISFYLYPIIYPTIQSINLSSTIVALYNEIDNDEKLNLTFSQYLSNSNGELVNEEQFKTYVNKNNTDKLKERIRILNQPLQDDLSIIINIIQSEFPKAENEDIKLIYEYARKFNIDMFYLYGIVATESSYRRTVVSKDDAYGLFQLQVAPAKESLDKYFPTATIIISGTKLLNSKLNIPLGIGYVKLIKDDYLKYVHDEKKKFILTTYSYIGGVGRILRIFDKDLVKAQKEINNMSLNRMETKIINHLMNIKFTHTINYPEKVYYYRQKFIESFRRYSI